MDNIGSSVGRITSGIRHDALLTKTMDYVHRQLPDWRDDPTRPAVQSEDELNAQLCKFLDSRAREQFPMIRFDHEERQTGRHYVDISASPIEAVIIGSRSYSIYDPFLVFEGKRLPAPAVDREKEYVTGFKKRSGGIQRFKLGLHGASVATAVMIGYIQDGSAQEWRQRINDWITDFASTPNADECVWNKSEFLGIGEGDWVVESTHYRSLHSRTGKVVSNHIELHHLWVKM